MKEEIVINNLPEYWKKIFCCAKEKIGSAYEKEMEHSNLFFAQYLLRRHISDYMFRDLLKISDFAIIYFFAKLYVKYGYKGVRPKSIISDKENELWLLERDFCFFNIRAIGNEVEETGNIIDAVKLLPALRVSAIHLAPFFECSAGIIYCQKSFFHINHEIVNVEYMDKGVLPKEQIFFFIDCCHLLNMAVGFDVTPHTSNDSVLRLQKPELFRWIKLAQDKTTLFDNMDIDVQYSVEFQNQCQKEVALVVEEEIKKNGIEQSDIWDMECIDKINKRLSALGYYTVPPHTWNGLSVPGFKKYAYNIQAPIWEYKDKYGQNQGQHAIWLHANFYIHKGLKANKIPVSYMLDDKEKGINVEFFNFFIDYLNDKVEQYLFDFLRIDYVDHIFDNVMKENGIEIPLNEMLTPVEINEIVKKLKNSWKGIGVLADHVGCDADKYYKAGFNLIISSHVAFEYNKCNLEKIFYDLCSSNSNNSNCFNTVWAIDTHDMAHPLFLGKELAHREGKVGMGVRFFLSRFANVGRNRHPKYEVIGNQDLSSGIHRANNRPESIAWNSDKELFELYHQIENQYELIKNDLQQSSLIQYMVTSNMAVFIIKKDDSAKYWIGMVPVPVTNDVEWKEEILKIPLDMELSKKNIIMHTKISLAVFKMEYLNFTDIDRLCDIQFSVRENVITVKLKQIGIALLELGF
ncbi:hypothetical protein [Anaerosacchariphilus polymeriproducens]|uniref:Uncharacterized protein n=1 Tax=Anaerosacchariphilus polymeriproducens TaxID=1812858 RepID=A0A371ASG0_9FIRM|nr:hypothetical protein [Anaerosacchariphilus polymeriproducens]RDU22507.1 hypothetical protein DWV06_14560 [Anaerosacchariphilus polymeriproducens]